jgi:hypothetical protein
MHVGRSHIEIGKPMPATTPKQKPFPDVETNGAKGDSNGYKRPSFVRCDLGADQKKEMAQWANNLGGNDLLDLLVVSITEGYTLSCKEAEVGYQASLTQGKSAGIGVPNVGKCLVTRASSPERALWSLYYKHTQVLEKDWSSASAEQQLEW